MASLEAMRLSIVDVLGASQRRPATALALIDGPFSPWKEGEKYVDFQQPQPPSETALQVEPIKGGDAKVYCIAAASILAKVTRDRLMRRCAAATVGWRAACSTSLPPPRRLFISATPAVRGPFLRRRYAELWPEYGLAEHKGYPTARRSGPASRAARAPRPSRGAMSPMMPTPLHRAGTWRRSPSTAPPPSTGAPSRRSRRRSCHRRPPTSFGRSRPSRLRRRRRKALRSPYVAGHPLVTTSRGGARAECAATRRQL